MSSVQLEHRKPSVEPRVVNVLRNLTIRNQCWRAENKRITLTDISRRVRAAPARERQSLKLATIVCVREAEEEEGDGEMEVGGTLGLRSGWLSASTAHHLGRVAHTALPSPFLACPCPQPSNRARAKSSSDPRLCCACVPAALRCAAQALALPREITAAGPSHTRPFPHPLLFCTTSLPLHLHLSTLPPPPPPPPPSIPSTLHTSRREYDAPPEEPGPTISCPAIPDHCCSALEKERATAPTKTGHNTKRFVTNFYSFRRV
jgi:hypothetical protein